MEKEKSIEGESESTKVKMVKVTLYEEDRKKREALEQKVATLEKLVTQQQEQIKKLSHFHKEKLNEEIIRQLQLKYKFFRKNFYAH